MVAVGPDGLRPDAVAPDPAPGLRVDILLLPNFTLSAFSLLLDPLRIAADRKDASRQIRCRWRVLSSNGLPVRASSGVEIYPTAKGCDVRNADWLMVVGGVLDTPFVPDAKVVDAIRRAASAGVNVMGVCTGVFTVAAAGILDGGQACVSWLHREAFEMTFDAVRADTSRVFSFGARYATCAGGIGAAHASLELIRRNLGRGLSMKCARILMLPRFWERDLSLLQLLVIAIIRVG